MHTRINTQPPVYAGAVVRAPGGDILCQLRDNKPDIICPGKWTCCPGGLVEQHESPLAAAIRELREEFNITVSPPQQLLVVTRQTGEYRGIYHGFFTDLLIPTESVQCNEGQAAEFFPMHAALDLPQHPVSREFLQQYQRLKHSQ